MATKAKQKTVATKLDHAQILKDFEKKQKENLEKLYKQLALIRKNVDSALTKIGFIDEADSLAEAAFKAGRAYTRLDEANDSLQEILDDIYDNHDVTHWEDIVNEKN